MQSSLCRAASRRIISLLSTTRTPLRTSAHQQLPWSFSSWNRQFRKFRNHNNVLLAKETHTTEGEDAHVHPKEHDHSVSLAALTVNGNESSVQSEREAEEEQVDHKARMAIIYTCKVCNTRSAQSFSKMSYEREVVIARCPGCNSLHLVADNKEWFGSHRNIEELMASKGETVTRRGSMTPEALQRLQSEFTRIRKDNEAKENQTDDKKEKHAEGEQEQETVISQKQEEMPHIELAEVMSTGGESTATTPDNRGQ